MRATKKNDKLTTGQAAKFIGLTAARLRQLAIAGEIKATKQASPLGDHWLIPLAEAIRIRDSRRR